MSDDPKDDAPALAPAEPAEKASALPQDEQARLTDDIVTALKTGAGGPFTLPSSTDGVYFQAATPTISVADSLPSGGAVSNGVLIYDHTTGVVTPVSLPNSTFRFVTAADMPN